MDAAISESADADAGATNADADAGTTNTDADVGATNTDADAGATNADAGAVDIEPACVPGTVTDWPTGQKTRALAMAPTSDGGVAIVGTDDGNSFSEKTYWLVRLSPSGTVLWSTVWLFRES